MEKEKKTKTGKEKETETANRSSIFTKEFHDAVSQVCEEDYSETSKYIEEKFGASLDDLSRQLEEQKSKQKTQKP